jgi:RND superfamily putative drug exporter
MYQRPNQSTIMRRFAKLVVNYPKLTAFVWLAVMLASVSAAVVVKPAFSTSVEIPASPSASGFELLERHFPGSSQAGSIVFSSASGVDDPVIRSTMESYFKKITDVGVLVLSPYDPQRTAAQISQDKKVAFAPLGTDPALDQTDLAELGTTLLSLRPVLDGLTVEVAGSAFAEFHPPESEALGLAFAVLILVLTLGSVLAMGLSVAAALLGVLIGTSLVVLASNLVSMPDFSTTLGSMLGIAVGIDYALFLVARFREYRAAGFTIESAVVEALDTSGRAVLFAGITVVVSLLGMLLMGLGFVSGLGIASATTVFITLLTSLTALPAFLVLAGPKVESTRRSAVLAAVLLAVGLVGFAFSLETLLYAFPLAVLAAVLGRFLPILKQYLPVRTTKELTSTFSYRWSRAVQRSPFKFLAVALVGLLLLTLPTFSLRLGFSDEGNFTPDTTTRRAYDLLTKGFGPGFNGPLVVVGSASTDPGFYSSLTAAIAADPLVAYATPPVVSDSKQAFVLQVFPRTSPQDEQTSALVQRLRTEVIPSLNSTPDVYVTGQTAASLDFTQYLSARLWVFIASVLLVSFLLLLMIFRSLLVPLKAVLMNLCSIAAAYGVVVAIFQWGWLASIFNVAPAPIDPFVPMMMFAILFGLSMDYEVFLLSRIKEEYGRTKDATSSVADGLAASARVITAAAAIMVVVFGGFLLEDVRVVKLFGVGLSVAVLLDATVVRLVLVPATMELLGSKNWYFPKFLDRLLPNLNIESSPHADTVTDKTSA